MNLTRIQLIDRLKAANIPTEVLDLYTPNEIEGMVFGSVSSGYVQRVWDSFIATLQADPNARLTAQRQLGGGKTRTVPNWVAPGAVCRHWAFAFYGFFLLCVMKLAVVRPQSNDGYALAVVYYTSQPRAENNWRQGRHARMFHVDDDGTLRQFEEGDGDPHSMTDAELRSITFMVFA